MIWNIGKKSIHERFIKMTEGRDNRRSVLEKYCLLALMNNQLSAYFKIPCRMFPNKRLIGIRILVIWNMLSV